MFVQLTDPVAEDAYPCAPAQAAVYVSVMGTARTVRFLLALGGAELPIARNPSPDCKLAQVVGHEHAIALGERWHEQQIRVPLCKPWVAACLKAEGMPVSDIARTLHVADTTVRGWLKVQAKRQGNG